jgi:ABC-2 type transport system permease protein
LNAFGRIFGEVNLELITPFKHFDPIFIVQNGAFDTPLVLANLAVTVVSLVVGYWLYIRRDIPAVS